MLPAVRNDDANNRNELKKRESYILTVYSYNENGPLMTILTVF
jgi:hypothetical protein